MTKKKKNNIEIEGAEFGVDSRYSSKKEQITESTALMEARLDRMKNNSNDQIIKAKLLQLKFRMEEYLQNQACEDNNLFTGFLKTYIDTIYNKRVDFANDISVTPVFLSQVLNNHKEPKEEFILKIMIHSEKAYKNICLFPYKTWYQVYFHEKLCNTISNQDKWRPNVEKNVKISKAIKVQFSNYKIRL